MKKLTFIFTTCFYAGMLVAQQSFVEVKDEPRHHLVFENDYLRILDVHLGPGDTTLYHRHKTPSVFITLSSNKVRSQLINKKPGEGGANIAGEFSYDTLAIERIHRVWNTDTVWMHVIDAELKTDNLKTKREKLSNKELILHFSEPFLNGYKMILAPGKSIQLPAARGGYLLVSLFETEATIDIDNSKEHRLMKAGHYQWISWGQKLKLQNSSGVDAEYALLQF